MKRNHKFEKTYFEASNSKYKAYKDMKLMKAVYFPKSVLDEGISPNCRMLDVGCAFGYFLKLCEDYGVETYGLDISEYAIERAKAITKAKLYLHDVNDGLKIFQKNFFDLITAFDVIEHLKNPANFLRESSRVLKLGGKLILTTPNFNAIARAWKQDKWYGCTDYSHIYLFTPSSLKFLVKEVGLGLIREETPFHAFPKFIQKIVNKIGLGGQIWLVCQKQVD